MKALDMLDQITPVILTYNEEVNIGRTLTQLAWARDIVIVDSMSSDNTAEIVAQFPQARLIKRKFDQHARQWSYATAETGIRSEWILALDADYIVVDQLIEEISHLDPADDIEGYTASFTYCVRGQPLRGTLYPPVTVLYRRKKGSFFQDGHTHRLKLEGRTCNLTNKLLHDDRKPLSHWLASQDRYMKLEAQHVLGQPWSRLCFADRIRRFPFLAPFAVFANCYLLKGGCLDGAAGLQYALQRMLAEALLGVRLIEGRPLESKEETLRRENL